jgi:hypothetical protein
MAKKPSKSILSGLKNMLHLDSEKSSKPSASPKKPVAAEKRSAPAQKPREQSTATPPAEAPGASAAAEAKPEKKVKNQPWYRHRQRW